MKNMHLRIRDNRKKRLNNLIFLKNKIQNQQFRGPKRFKKRVILQIIK